MGAKRGCFLRLIMEEVLWCESARRHEMRCLPQDVVLEHGKCLTHKQRIYTRLLHQTYIHQTLCFWDSASRR